MKKLTLALLFISFLAQAKVDSNYTLTPAEGQHEVNPGAKLSAGTTEDKGNLGDTKFVGINLNASYFYGFTDYLSAGVALEYSAIRSEQKGQNFNLGTTTGKGFSDPVISVKGNVDVNNLGLYYSVGYGIAAEKKKINQDDLKYNMASGQNSYRLAVGLAVPVEEYTIGAIIHYQKNLKGKETTTLTGIDTELDISESSSHIAKLYMEFEKEYHITGAFIHQRYDYLYQGLEFSARIETGPQAEVIPQITALVMKHPEDINANHDSAVYIGASFRYLF